MNVREFVNYCRKSRVVRVAFIYVPLAWFALRAILIALPGLDAPGWVPKLFGVLLLIGYPIALIASWAMDTGDEDEQAKSQGSGVIVPEGSSAKSREQTSAKTFGTLLVVGMAVLGAAIYFMLNPTLPIVGRSDGDNYSVAVLPFLNLSADEGHQIFCDGLSEELLNLLTRVQSLHVAARTSSFALRGSELDIPSIGKKLRVSHVVEGSVRRDGKNIRVTAQLVRSSDGYHVWSENYDREFTEIFEIQDDIATNIVGRLVASFKGKSALDSVPKIQQTQPDAYFAYLQGRGALSYAGDGYLLQAAELFEDALEISPTYQPAIVGQVYTQALIGLSDGQPVADRRYLFNQALQLLADTQSDAWAATAVAVLGMSLYEWERTKDTLELGLGAHLNDVGLASLYAELLIVLGDTDAAVLELNRIDEFAPGLASTPYLRALADYDASADALENLFVLAVNARNWHAASMPASVIEARRQTYQRCSSKYATLTGSAAEDFTTCAALGSFQVPLLAMHGKKSDALDKLIAMISTRTFNAAIVNLPQSLAILNEPAAATARAILNLPATRQNLVDASVSR